MAAFDLRPRLEVIDAERLDQPGAQLDVSVIVPFKDEQDSLIELAERVTSVLRREGKRFELVLVDDGSNDLSWERALEACATHPEVRALRQQRCYGKATALGTGFHVACGAVLITMDADLQDDPAEIPRFLRAIEDGYDVVSGWKRERHDPIGKTAPSKLFNAVARRTSGVQLHDFNCGFKAYTAAAAREVVPHLYGDMHRYLPVLLGASGFRIGELEVHHHARRYGHSKYGIGRVLAGACDLLTVTLVTRFRYRPLHAFGGAAVLLACAVLAAALAMTCVAGVSAAVFETAIVGVVGTLVLLGSGLVCELIVLTVGPSPVGGRMSESARAGAGAGEPSRVAVAEGAGHA